MENLYNYVYLTINKINGKCYVGSHASKYENDNYLGSGNLIKLAINKYGKSNFLKIKLKNYDTILEARLNECTYIEKFDSIAPTGYNISPVGGCNFKNGIASEETRKKLSKALKGKPHTEKHNENVGLALKGKKHNPQVSINTWITRRLLNKTEPWNKNKRGIYSSETIKKLSDARKGTHHNEESKTKTRNALKNRPLKVNNMKKECEHCGIITNLGNYNRWHGDKCKKK